MAFNYYTQLPQNLQSSLTVNISKSPAIRHVSVYSKPYALNTLAAPFSSLSGTLQLASDLPDPAVQQNLRQTVNDWQVLTMQISL